MTKQEIFALERPDPSLWKLYMIRSLLAGPFFPLVILPFYFRYKTLRYRFDEEGIHMKWGILFRKEVNLTYARIQDIHLRSGVVQRWLGLADLMVQTASGSAGPEMTIEGFKQFEKIQDFLYTRMRGYVTPSSSPGSPQNTPAPSKISTPKLSLGASPPPAAAEPISAVAEPSQVAVGPTQAAPDPMHELQAPAPSANVQTPAAPTEPTPELSQVLLQIRDELRGTREALEQIRQKQD